MVLVVYPPTLCGVWILVSGVFVGFSVNLALRSEAIRFSWHVYGTNMWLFTSFLCNSRKTSNMFKYDFCPHVVCFPLVAHLH